MNELGILSNSGDAPARPMFSMFAPPMTGRSVFGADPNRAGHDDYFNRLKEMHQRGGKKPLKLNRNTAFFDLNFN